MTPCAVKTDGDPWTLAQKSKNSGARDLPREWCAPIDDFLHLANHCSSSHRTKPNFALYTKILDAKSTPANYLSVQA